MAHWWPLSFKYIDMHEYSFLLNFSTFCMFQPDYFFPGGIKNTYSKLSLHFAGVRCSCYIMCGLFDVNLLSMKPSTVRGRNVNIWLSFHEQKGRFPGRKRRGVKRKKNRTISNMTCGTTIPAQINVHHKGSTLTAQNTSYKSSSVNKPRWIRRFTQFLHLNFCQSSYSRQQNNS